MAKTTAAKTKATATKKAPKKSVKTTRQVQSRATTDFFEARITDQTLYWLIFGAAAIIFALWLFSLDAKVRDLYDQIDANTYDSSLTIEESKKKE